MSALSKLHGYLERTGKPDNVHTTTAGYEELSRYTYDMDHTNYIPLKSQMRAVPMGEGFLDYVQRFR